MVVGSSRMVAANSGIFSGGKIAPGAGPPRSSGHGPAPASTDRRQHQERQLIRRHLQASLYRQQRQGLQESARPGRKVLGLPEIL